MNLKKLHEEKCHFMKVVRKLPTLGRSLTLYYLSYRNRREKKSLTIYVMLDEKTYNCIHGFLYFFSEKNIIIFYLDYTGSSNREPEIKKYG